MPQTILQPGLDPACARFPAKDGSWAIEIHKAPAELEASWRSVEASGRLTPFQGFAWVASLARLATGKKRAAPVIVEVKDRLGATALILPLCVQQFFGCAVLGFLDLGVSDYGAPAFGLAWEQMRVNAEELLSAILRQVPRVDFVRLERMPVHVGEMRNPLVELDGTVADPTPFYQIALAGPADAALRQALRPSTFRDLSKARRKLERKGELRFAEADTESEIDRVFEVMLAQRRARFDQMERSNLLADPDFVAFYREAAMSGLENGGVRLFSLTLDGEIIATAYTLTRSDTLSLVIQTMDMDHRASSPGAVITASLLEWAAGRGMTCFDLSIGFQPYKVSFGAPEGELRRLDRAVTLRGRLALSAERSWKRALAMVRDRAPDLHARLRQWRARLRR